MTETDMIITHLKERGSISSFDAYRLYNVTRLSALIFCLRKKYMIDTHYEYTTNSYGRKIRYGIYTLHDEKDEC